MEKSKLDLLINDIEMLMEDEKNKSIEYQYKDWLCGYHIGKYDAYEQMLELLKNIK